MPNLIQIGVENADELLNAGAYGAGAVIAVEWSATENGSFAALSGSGSTPSVPLVSGTRSYTAYDPNGSSGTWYRVRYEDSGATRTSDWLPAFQVGDESGGFLFSRYDAKQRLGLEDDDPSEDENIGEYQRQITSYIQSMTGRQFVRKPLSGTAEFLFDMRAPGRVLRIPRGINAVTQLEVAEESQPPTGGTYTVMNAADYFLRPHDHERDDGWPATSIQITDQTVASGLVRFEAGFNVVRLTGALGWDAVPGDIQNIALNLLVAYHRERGSSGSAGEVFTVNVDGSRSYERVLSSKDRATLRWYRGLRVA